MTSSNTSSTSNNLIEPSPNDRFLFDCEHLLQFTDILNRTEVEDQNESVLEVKLKDLERRWVKLDTSYQNVMLSQSYSVDSEIKIQAKNEYEACTSAYYHCSSQLMDLIKVSRLDSTTMPGFQSTYRQSNPPQALMQNIMHDNASDCIKLPPCDTEIFKGSYEQWPSFRDMFTAVYINHSRLTPVTKLYHLRNKTRGEAGDIVKRYPLSHGNFELAWNALISRYENKRVLVDNQIKILFDIPSATNEDSESIRKIQSSVNDSLATLKILGVAVESWDPILIRLISTKLPELTLSLWEQSLTSPRELPKWSQMSQFLVDRYEAVERLTSIRNSKGSMSLYKSPNLQTFVSQEELNPSCKLCKEYHTLRTCPQFRSFAVQERVDFVFKNKYCNNCLGHNHIKADCKSKRTCIYCKKSHHTLLHMTKGSQNIIVNKDISQNVLNKTTKPENSYPNGKKNETQREQPSTSKHFQANCSTNNENILLRTAIMQIESRGELFTIRALIDPGSQRTFLSERIRNRLQLPYQKSHFEISGIGGQKQIANKECEFILYARRSNIKIPIKAIVLPKVTKQLPAYSFKISYTEELKILDLADPTFYKSSQIDLILGNDYEHSINLDGIKRNVCGKTSAYNTIFGWVLSGPIAAEPIQSYTTEVSEYEIELNNILRKFWEDEEVPSVYANSTDDEFCEKFYSQTTIRHTDGRYVVRLPFRTEFPKEIFLGSSRFIALAQYSRMEKTLSKNPDLHTQYNEVLEEYSNLDHMEESSSQEIVSNGKYHSYYLPHHAVVRPEHKTTKVRVVFNASRKTKSQFSLNDVLYTGPTLQTDLITTILNWRKYRFVFSGDIQKMYRQILVHPDDRPYQKILFQSQPNSPIKDFQLKTVTFGVNCAPFLAIRTLLQLASDVELQYPKASAILRTETYVDDILSGGYIIEETLASQTQLIKALNSAGFPLKKITANDPQLLSNIPKEDLYDLEFLRFHETSATKTLGIIWNALNDTFSYKFAEIDQTSKITKRQILSAIAKLFDPAGWLAPIVIRAKILMQQLWLQKLQWDEEISTDYIQIWNNLVQDFKLVETISIPRWLQYFPTDSIQIHGFSDASQSAYCAALYIRCQTHTHTTYVNLLVAKCKVAPIQTVCLPRLELNGALLLVKLLNYVQSTLKFNSKETHLWTDSSIVLGWLSKPPSTWETYVANRIAQINILAPNAIWHHISSQDNPADLGTRGCRPQDLANNSLWWHGPSWLTNPSSTWPKRNPLNSISKCITETQSLHSELENYEILNKYSSYSKALRVICYIFRFINKSIKKQIPNTDGNAHDHLTQQEMKFAKSRLISLAQQKFYPEEYNCLKTTKTISNKSSLKSLNPFLDENSVMRVNGRLSESSLPYSERYPIILPGNSQFCHLYLAHLHQVLCHAQCSQMYRAVQSEFFVFRLKPRIKKVIRHCKTCMVYKQQPCSQIMAPLPPERCNLSLPFQITGIDFAGPFEIKTSQLRKSPYVKGYVSVFVCFSTKAIHLEPCSDLSSAAFEAAFSRFVGRRGLPQRVVTDNGRNFLGCSRALEFEFSAFIENSAHDIAQKYITHGFEWKFIPPHAPHMGGLWEAAVKSFKYHLKRVAGSHKFTFEELATVLAKIEGVLNSRPISALSEDPTDLTALTPGHFLRGAPLMAFPEQGFQNISLINRWEKLKSIHHQWSIRWKEDYLKSLHKRTKWKNSAPNIHVGDLVVVIDDLLPPHEWRLGRIENTFPGSDNNIRTANVRIATGVITRPIVKLCLLPLAKEDEN